MFDTELYVVLSTAHLDPITMETLDQTGLIYDDGEARVRIRIPQESDPRSALTIPDDLAEAFKLISQKLPEAYGIMYDRDGPVVDGLPIHTWFGS